MDKKKLAILSIVLPIIAIIFLIVVPDKTIKIDMIMVLIALLISIVGVVCGFKAKKEAKGLSIVGIIIGILISVLLLFSFLGFVMYKNATDCEKVNETYAKCKYSGREIEVPMQYVTEEMMKK